MRHVRSLRQLVLCLILLVAAPVAVPAQEMQPLMQGWEQHFSVTWDAVQRRGPTEVEGYVINKSPYRVGRLRVLVDSRGVARSAREAPEIDGIVHVSNDVPVGEFATVEIADALGPDLVAVGATAGESDGDGR